MMSEDVNMMEATPAGMADINIQETDLRMNPDHLFSLSYDELRKEMKKSPKFIRTIRSNKAPIILDTTTQADIDLFNNKYGVQLVLPQEA